MKLLDRARSFAASDELTLEFASVPLTSDRLRKDGGASSSVQGRDGNWYFGANELAGGDDINQVWSGRAKYPIIREMRHDPAVKSLEWMTRMPISSAKWKLDPASEDPVDQVVADYLAWQFGLGEVIPGRKHALARINQTWKESVTQALLVLPYGAMGEELCWAEAEDWKDADGDSHLIVPLSRLAPRMPSTVGDYRVNETSGELEWLHQDVVGAEPIPAEKLAWYVLDGEAGSIWGTSFLRAAYGPWKLKRSLMVAAAIGWDRHAAGTPVVRYPQGGGPQDRQRAETIGKNWRSHERAWVTFEGRKEDGWDVEIVGGNGTLADPVNLLRWYDQQIAMSGLQQFSSLGTTETGSRAVGEVLADPFYLAVTAIAESLAAARMKQVFRRVIDMNFGKDVAMPELLVTDIATEDTEKLARTISELSTAGFSFTDPDTQNDIRRRLKLSELPEGTAEAIDGLPDTVGVQRVLPQAPANEGGSITAPAAVA